MLEEAVDRHTLTLCVILLHAHCDILHRASQPKEPATRVRRELTIAMTQSVAVAKQSGRTLEEAHALRQAQVIYRLSPKLEALHRDGDFQIAIAIVEDQSSIRAKGKRIRWIAPWLRSPPKRVGARPDRR